MAKTVYFILFLISSANIINAAPHVGCCASGTSKVSVTQIVVDHQETDTSQSYSGNLPKVNAQSVSSDLPLSSKLPSNPLTVPPTEDVPPAVPPTEDVPPAIPLRNIINTNINPLVSPKNEEASPSLSPNIKPNRLPISSASKPSLNLESSESTYARLSYGNHVSKSVKEAFRVTASELNNSPKTVQQTANAGLSDSESISLGSKTPLPSSVQNLPKPVSTPQAPATSAASTRITYSEMARLGWNTPQASASSSLATSIIRNSKTYAPAHTSNFAAASLNVATIGFLGK